MKAGDIVLAQLQQADGEYKLRPVLLLKQFPRFGDWLACGISSQVRHALSDFDEVILESDDDFSQTGLHVSSVVRLGFLATIPEKDLPGAIGNIHREAPKIVEKLDSILKRRLKLQKSRASTFFGG